jgi:HD-like signal output (HDOD) protein/DNA-binding response OmpR family regulator
MPAQILLVDDEPNLTSALKHTLYKEKHKIFTADSASEALAILSRENIDVLVTDEQMPGMTGSELITIARRKYPETIRIILTGQASSDGALRAINEGQAYRFLVKPCHGLDLVITIRRALQYKELVAKTRQMLNCIKQQSSLLQLLENTHPEIARTIGNSRRAIMSDKAYESHDELIEMIDVETKRLETFLKNCEKGVTSTPSTDNTTGLHSENHSDSIDNSMEPPAIAGSQEISDHSSPATITSAEPNPETRPSEIPKTLSANDYGEEIKDIKDLKPIMTRSEIQELLDQCGELKGMSPTVTQILKSTQSEQCSIDEVVKVIKQDHAISLKVLKMANSVVYTRGEPIDTVQKAVMRIGLSQIRQLALNISVIDQFANGGQNDSLSIPLFWEHSIATGMIAAEITRSLGGKGSQIDAAFTMGLLHDIGRIVYLEMLGEKYISILKMAKESRLPLERVESRMLLINHADAMDRILHKWKFCKEMINPIAFHELSLGNIRRMAPRSLNEVATLALSNRLAHALLLGTSGNLTLYPTEEFANTLRLKSALFRSIEENIPPQTDDVKYSLLSHSNQQSWPRLRDELAKQFHKPFRPLYASAEPDFDSVRIFCDRLRDTSEEPPNIGIIHIKNGGQRVLLTTKYKEAETKAGDLRLPLIILSPKGDIKLEDSFMEDRQVELLPLPVSIACFIDASNKLLTLSPMAAAI